MKFLEKVINEFADWWQDMHERHGLAFYVCLYLLAAVTYTFAVPPRCTPEGDWEEDYRQIQREQGYNL